MRPPHPSIEPLGATGKWQCLRCQRVAPKEDLLNPRLSHSQCFNPHSRLERMGAAPLDLWRCMYCHHIDKYEYFETVECTDFPKICEYCGERPECARDCIGIRMALMDPNIRVISDEDLENRSNPDDSLKKQIRDEDEIGALNFLRRKGHKFYLLIRRDYEQTDEMNQRWLLPYKSERILHVAMVEDLENLSQRWPAFPGAEEQHIDSVIKHAKDQLQQYEILPYPIYRQVTDILFNTYEITWEMLPLVLTEKPKIRSAGESHHG